MEESRREVVLVVHWAGGSHSELRVKKNAPHVAPEDIDGVGRSPFVLGLGQAVKFVGRFFGNLTLGMVPMVGTSAGSYLGTSLNLHATGVKSTSSPQGSGRRLDGSSK